jgi:FdhD protein
MLDAGWHFFFWMLEAMISNMTCRTFRTFTLNRGSISPVLTDLTVEAPLQIIINDQPNILLMFTPHMVRELAVGFVFTEGLITDVTEITGLSVFEDRREDGDSIIEARMQLAPKAPYSSPVSGKRISYSSCGICGTENYDHLRDRLKRVKSRQRFSMDMLQQASSGLKAFQPLYRRTGGAHAAVLFDSKGNKVLHAEDMGRHNALDKVIGASLIQGILPDDKLLVSSGRASLEMILKVARIGFPVFVAMSRPTSRAVEAAKFYNITLIDLAKDTNRIYSHARRIEEF